MTPKEIRNKLKDCNLAAVSKNSGVSYRVLYRFVKGSDAKYSTIEKLSNYLENKENGK